MITKARRTLGWKTVSDSCEASHEQGQIDRRYSTRKIPSCLSYDKIMVKIGKHTIVIR